MSSMMSLPPPYPLSEFHLISENAAHEVQWHLKAPGALIGMSVLTVMDVACQGCADVAIPIANSPSSDDQDSAASDDQICRRVPLSLNLLSLAESGERKTTVDHVVGAPLYANDEMQAMQHASNVAASEFDSSVWLSIERGIRRKITQLTLDGEPTEDVIATLKEHTAKKPAQPRLRRTVRSDITKTSIAEALQGDGESIALMSNEGDILLNGEAMKHLSWLNSAWDGSPLSLDRGNNRNLLARNPRVTTSIVVQPSVFQEYLATHGKKARGIGYFARYLVGWPRSTQGERFISGYEGEWTHLPVFHARVKALLEKYASRIASGDVKRDVIHFTEEARVRWIALVNDTEEKIQPIGSLREVKDFAAKACEITARVAGVLHYFSDQPGGITIDTLERAASIVEWHMDECARIFVPENEVPQALIDAEKLRDYLFRVQEERIDANKDPRNQLKDPYSFVRSEANHCGPVRKAPFRAALEVLVARDVVRVERLHRFPKPSGPLCIFHNEAIRYPLQF